MFGLRSNGSALDTPDRAILRELFENGRLSRAELARRVGLSPPSVGERVLRLEERGVIRGYRADLDPAAMGAALTVMIRARPLPGSMGAMLEAMRRTPQIVHCERVSGEDCFVARAHVRSVREMEEVIDRLVPHGATNTSVVQSEPIPPRLPAVLGAPEVPTVWATPEVPGKG